MSRKRSLVRAALWPIIDSADDTPQLQAALRKDKFDACGDIMNASIRMMFTRDAEVDGLIMDYGSYRIS